MQVPEVEDDSIGPKIAAFYFSLRGGGAENEDTVRPIILSLKNLELHIPQLKNSESEEIVSEILADCHKKSAQILRVPYAEAVRNLIAASRKKLAAKVALDADSSSQHSQRHLNTLLELLGSWSNIVGEV
jgi:hypothetical protein